MRLGLLAPIGLQTKSYAEYIGEELARAGGTV